MNKKRKLNKKMLFLFIFIVIFLIMFIVSIIKILFYINDNKNNKVIQDNIIKESITIINSKSNDKEETKYKVDFKSLKEKNSDTIAYLKVNGTNIDYIVVRGNDNNYYLKHNFEKNWNISGWIFSDYRNKFDGTDKNIVIFGHNTKDGSMFGTLKKVLNKDWYKNKDNHNIILVTEEDTYYYKVFSTYSIKAEDYYINTKFKNNNEFGEFTNTIKSRSIYDYNVEVNNADKILTLSSCIGDGKKRVVLHAKLIIKDIL